MSAGFYRAFEERYRGSQEQIKSRLRVYLPFVEPLTGWYADAKAVDLGCGRGEWLELLEAAGLDAQGVDLDDGMLAACRELGLKVQSLEALSFLQELPEASQVVVSAIHIVEHIPFSDLQALVEEALRVLKPGGLLIMETPNPENLVVGTEGFYLDPTHRQPIPSQLLSFMAEYSGFEKVKVLRLQEQAGLAEKKALTLLSVLNGVSPDYAVVAQKGGAAEIVAAIASAFDTDYGISLESLASKYDQQVEAKAQQARDQQAKIQQTEAKALQAETIAQQAEAKALQAETIAQQAEAKAQQAETALIAINNSSSWRLTEPLRMVGRAAKNVFRLAKVAKPKSKEKIKLLLAHARLYVNQRPQLRRMSFAVLARFPTLKGCIRRAMRAVSSEQIGRPDATELASLTPRARSIYADLKSARQNHNKEDF